MHDVSIHSDHSCIVFNLDESESIPDKISIKRNDNNKTFHGFQLIVKQQNQYIKICLKLNLIKPQKKAQ